MDPWAIATAIAILVAGGATAVALRRGRALDQVREALAIRPAVDPRPAVVRLSEELQELGRELTDEQRDHQSLIESLPLGVLRLDPSLRVLSANDAAHGLLDRRPGTLLGRDAIELFLDTRIEAIGQAALAEGRAAGELRPGGTTGPTLAVRARRSAAGGVWLVLEDVSELRRLQQIRTEFIDNLSHELRTPLTTIRLLAETLADEAERSGVPAAMAERIGKIEVETGHLVQMVEELLDLSRIESGRALALLDDVDLGQLATAAVDRLRLFADRQGVALRTDLPDRVPRVRGDAGRLGQVLVNLVHNAVKFSPDGGRVTVGVEVEDGSVVTSVTDQGIGITREAQTRIFERFYKVDRARVRGEAGGTGLGLAIARHAVEQHGGRIGVRSEEGRGSTFWFSVPIPEESA
ncbi:MAG: sensor histidine kinase [Chloroflexota bacterium]